MRKIFDHLFPSPSIVKWMARGPFPLLFLFVFLPSALAIEVKAQAGFRGFYSPGKWTPISVTAENLPRADKARQKLEAFEGFCEVRSAGAHGDTSQIGFTRPLSVPVQDRKRVFLYAKFPETRDAAEVALVDSGGKKIATVMAPRVPVDHQRPLILAVGGDGSSFHIPGVPNLPAPQIVHVDPEELPDQWFGYDGVALVVISGATERLLQQDKLSPLQKWAAQGGRILVQGGRYGYTYRNSPLSSMLPVEYVDSAAYVLGPEGLQPVEDGETTSAAAFQVNELSMKPGAEIAYKSAGLPILVRAQYESGEIFYMTADMNSSLEQEMPVGKMLHSYIASVPDFERGIETFRRDVAYGRDSSHLGLGTANMLPDLTIVFGILASYFVLVGPVNFLLLARKKKLEYAWLTIPAIVLVYSGGIYLFSTRIKGDENIHRTYHLLTGKTNSTHLRSDSASMLFLSSPGRRSIDALSTEVAETGLTVWMDSSGGGSAYYSGPFRRQQGIYAAASDAAEPSYRVIQRAEGMSIVGKGIAQWAEDFSQFEGVIKLPGAIESDLKYDSQTLSGIVRNNSGRDIANLHLIFGGRAWPLGEENPSNVLKDGESAEVSISPLKEQGNSAQTVIPSMASGDLESAVLRVFSKSIVEDQSAPICVIGGEFAEPPYKVAVDASNLKGSTHSYFALAADLKYDNSAAAEAANIEDMVSSRWALSAITEDSCVGCVHGETPFEGDDIVYTIHLEPVARALPVGFGRFTFYLENSTSQLKLFVLDPEAYTWKELDFEVVASSPPGQVRHGMAHQNQDLPAKFEIASLGSFMHPLSDSVMLRFNREGSSNFSFQHSEQSYVGIPQILASEPDESNQPYIGTAND